MQNGVGWQIEMEIVVLKKLTSKNMRQCYSQFSALYSRYEGVAHPPEPYHKPEPAYHPAPYHPPEPAYKPYNRY